MEAKKYLLDTNIITYLQEQSSLFHHPVKNRLSALNDEDQVYVSVFSFYEIEYGIAVSETGEMRETFALMKEAMRRDFPVLPFTEKGSEVFGILKVGYMKQTGITKKAVKKHDIDFMLASSAIVKNAVMVTNDNIFEELKKLRPDFQLENWTETG